MYLKIFFIPDGILDALETNPPPPPLVQSTPGITEIVYCAGKEQPRVIPRIRRILQRGGESRRKEGIAERNERTIDGIDQIEIHQP